jgi:hypothetical protein
MIQDMRQDEYCEIKVRSIECPKCCRWMASGTPGEHRLPVWRFRSISSRNAEMCLGVYT